MSLFGHQVFLNGWPLLLFNATFETWRCSSPCLSEAGQSACTKMNAAHRIHCKRQQKKKHILLQKSFFHFSSICLFKQHLSSLVVVLAVLRVVSGKGVSSQAAGHAWAWSQRHSLRFLCFVVSSVHHGQLRKRLWHKMQLLAQRFPQLGARRATTIKEKQVYKI